MSTFRPERLRFQSGLTLLEMILFIVVVGVAGVALLSALSAPLTGAGTQTATLTGAQVAQARMELMLGQKRKAGYPDDPANCEAELDPCSSTTLAACDVPAGWTVNASCTPWSVNADTADYVVLVVSASGPEGAGATARTLIANLAD